MPIYAHECLVCGSRRDLWLRIRDLDSRQECDCGGDLVRRISAPFVQGDYPGYLSHGTGKWVEGRKAHLRDLQECNCRVYEPGETESFIRGKADREKAFGDAVEAVVDKTAQELAIGG